MVLQNLNPQIRFFMRFLEFFVILCFFFSYLSWLFDLFFHFELRRPSAMIIAVQSTIFNEFFRCYRDIPNFIRSSFKICLCAFFTYVFLTLGNFRALAQQHCHLRSICGCMLKTVQTLKIYFNRLLSLRLFIFHYNDAVCRLTVYTHCIAYTTDTRILK